MADTTVVLTLPRSMIKMADKDEPKIKKQRKKKPVAADAAKIKRAPKTDVPKKK